MHHTYLPPPSDSVLHVWIVTREHLADGLTVPLGRWPCYTSQEAVIVAARHEIPRPTAGAYVYHAVCPDDTLDGGAATPTLGATGGTP